MEFDEQLAIQYIRDNVDADILSGFNDDMLLEIIDIIWDFYEDHGMLDITLDDNDDDDDIDLDELSAHALKLLRKTYPDMARDRQSSESLKDKLKTIIAAEIMYEATLDE